MKPVLVGITGFAQVGKDTAASYLEHAYGYKRRAFADALRDVTERVNPYVQGPIRYNAAVEAMGYEAAKARIPEVRGFLKGLGNAVREVLGENSWVNAALKDVKEPTSVSDVRFVNEAECIHQKAHFLNGRALIIRIHRPGYDAESEFEKQVDYIACDYAIWNDGSVEDLYAGLDLIMSSEGVSPL